MDNIVRDLIVIVLAIWITIWWWRTAKVRASRKYIILAGISLIISGISSIIKELLDILAFSAIWVVSMIIFVYFFIRAALSERKAKNESSED